jgi:hypothetical protein
MQCNKVYSGQDKRDLGMITRYQYCRTGDNDQWPVDQHLRQPLNLGQSNFDDLALQHVVPSTKRCQQAATSTSI